MTRRVLWSAVFLCVVGALAQRSDAQDSWVGRKVMPKHHCQPMLGEEKVALGLLSQPFTVRSINGEWLGVGRAWVRASEVIPLEDAAEYYTESLRNDPESAWTYVERGMVWDAKGELDNAIKDYTEVIRLVPTHPFAYNNRGTLWEAKGELDNAMKDYTEAIRLDPHYVFAYNNRGIVWKKKGELDNAIRDYSVAIRLDPKYAIAYRNRALVWSQKGKLNNAIGDCSAAIRLDPKYAIAYRNRAVAWSQKGKPDNAIKDYTEAIRLDPKDANAYNNRGIVWTSKGEFGNAIKDYTEAIRLDPQYASAHNGLAWLLATCPNEKYRNGKQAVADATKACELTHWKNSSFCDTLAVAYAELGDFAAAVKWQTKAIELVASDPASVQEYRDRLELYRQHKPFREPSREGGEKKKEMEAKTVQPPL